jgi:hypothetical protein
MVFDHIILWYYSSRWDGGHALLADFEQHGAATIARVRVEEPHTFLWLMTATVPNRVAITGSDALDVNSEALSAALAALGLDREN